MLKKNLLFFVIILAGCATTRTQKTPSGQGAQNNPLPGKLTGLWEFKGMKTSNPYNRGFNKVPPGQFKLYGGDGAFANFGMIRSGAALSSEGTWKAVSDSSLIEHVSRSIHEDLAEKQDTLYFKLNGKGLLYLKWHRDKDNNGNPADVWIEELWKKVDFPLGISAPVTS